jgi:hypothetical protein
MAPARTAGISELVQIEFVVHATGWDPGLGVVDRAALPATPTCPCSIERLDAMRTAVGIDTSKLCCPLDHNWSLSAIVLYTLYVDRRDSAPYSALATRGILNSLTAGTHARVDGHQSVKCHQQNRLRHLSLQINNSFGVFGN